MFSAKDEGGLLPNGRKNALKDHSRKAAFILL
jgi:hypothetical protein